MAPEPAGKWVFPELRNMILQTARKTSNDAEKENEQARSASNFLTPSFTESNVPWAVEQQLRRTTCTFVEHLAQLLEMPEAPSISAQLFIQRFYMMHSFATHDRFLVATAALFLAGKTEEFPVKVRYITECSMYLLLCREQAQEKLMKKHKGHVLKGSGSTASRHSPSPAEPIKKKQRMDLKGKPLEMPTTLEKDKDNANTKHIEWLNAILEFVEVGEVEANASKVLLLERILLLSLSFEIAAPQPFAYVARHMERIFALEAMHPDISYENIRQVTFMLIADAIKSGLILAFDCIALAAGAVYLACLYHYQVGPNVATEKNEPWWTVLQLPEKELEEVARSYLWMYEDRNGDKIKGLGPDFMDLWTRYRPSFNRPDLEYVKELDAPLKAP
ncbi:cyclin-t1 family protein isoform 1 [Plasmopara halstedii]|uniref:Tpa: cyclin-t1 family protein isoform 1 n=1 Tax=Plasmopara halstedii TaxID=4781 RepID=A0A0P1A8B6_PLAHL|nr:cyclin-t1 family protein isoform 1 [Plasmopara halstedii]CEG36519.1 cyclin-t1 family protein isoform 1 [Plasmopara halstedii]|eukprot:XP_024572888.1 cyclin-t1 family protein isoform 1 [Plasmopara halstedii]